MITITDTAMRWFGPSWNAPLNEACDRVETPVGESCARCEERIETLDQGVLMWHVTLAGGQTMGKSEVPRYVSGFRPLHYCCFMRQSIGGVGHVLLHGKGGCGGTCPSDPDWLPRRKAAEIAVQLWELAP